MTFDWKLFKLSLWELLQQRLERPLNQVFPFLQEEATIRRGGVVIDCGANRGNVTSRLRRFGATVHAFEPNPYAFDYLRKRFRFCRNVHCIPKAVAAVSGKQKLFFHEASEDDPLLYSSGSSLLANKTNVSAERFVEVDVVRLVDFLAPFDFIDFIKIDIEGAEYELLDDLIESDCIEKVGYVAVETHAKKNAFLMGKHERLVAKLHDLKLTKTIDLNWR